MSEETDAKADRNIREQYEALGRFVEAFEQMVHEARSAAEFLLDPKLERQSVVSTALHHSVMTAKPIFEIMRAVIAETLKNRIMRAQHAIDSEAENIFHGVLQVISKEYTDLGNIRNNLLHSTWLMGLGDIIDPTYPDFFVHKMSVSKTGIEPMELPKNVQELLALAARCRKTAGWIGAVAITFITGPAGEKIKATFRHDRKHWIRRGPAGDETLP